jgi:hypothetical protein
MSKKRKVSPMKPTSWKKSKASNPKLQTVLTVDDINLIIATVLDTSEDILQCNEAKQKSMYDCIEAELKGIQHALHSSRTVPTGSLSAGNIEVGDELAQLRRIADATEACLRRVQEEKEHVIEALK